MPGGDGREYMEVYLDNSATTKPFESVLRVMNDVYTNGYGNPSSKHLMGVGAEKYLKEASGIIAKNLKAQSSEILFTSGGTESDNTALIGAARAGKRRGNRIITTRIEHPAILETCKFLEDEGYEVIYLPVDRDGIVDMEYLASSLNDKTLIVSVMHTNNEIGAVEPIAEIGKLIKKFDEKILFHVDAVQGYGKNRIIPKNSNIDMMSVSAHKIHGPKGIGFLYIKDGVKLSPYILGGGQQKNMRSGTENVPAIAGMAEAVRCIYENFDEDIERISQNKQRLIEGLSAMDMVTVNGRISHETAPHIVSASVKGVRAEVLLHALEEKGIYVSSGSACASNKNSISGTLSSINLDKELLDSTIRMSLSVFTTKEEIDYTIDALNQCIPELRKYTRR